MKINNAAVALASVVVGISPVWGFEFNDIKQWVGEGTNRCAVVIDFNDGGAGDRSFAWGYRWNGEAPSVKAILDAITARDHRLKMFASLGQYGSFIEAFAYDADADGGTFERVWNNEAYAYDFLKSDVDDIFPATESDSYIDSVTGYNVYTGTSWMQLAGTGDAFEDVVFAETPDGVDITNPEDGDWICWRLCPYSSEYDAEWNPIGYESIETSPYIPVAAAFRMNNIQYWVGQGTNHCAIVVDFNDGEAGNRSFAWGYRWNGDAPSVTAIMNEITANDPRLKMFASTSQYGSFIEAFAYDADGDGGTFERVWNANTYAYDFVKSDNDDIFPSLVSNSDVDAETGNYVYAGTSWMLLSGTETCFENVSFAETPDGTDLTNPQNGEWICWRICPYTSIYDSDWNPIGYECDTYSEHVAVAAYPSEACTAALPKVGYSTYASLDAAFDAARGGGSVTLPVQSSVDTAAKTVTVGTAADETLQTYEVPAYFDMSVSGDAVKLTLNAVATPTVAAAVSEEEQPLTVSDTTVTVVPGNVIDGLYYGLAVSTNLTAGFSAPTEWVRAANGRVVLEKAKNAAASGEFYKVRVSDIDESAK